MVCIREGADTGSPHATISVDLSDTFLALLKLINDQGYKKVGFISEELTVSRLNNFKHAMRKVGLPLKNEYIAVPKGARFADVGITASTVEQR